MEPQHGSRSARACMVSVDRWVENDGLAYLVLSTLFITTTVCMTYALGYYEGVHHVPLLMARAAAEPAAPHGSGLVGGAAAHAHLLSSRNHTAAHFDTLDPGSKVTHQRDQQRNRDPVLAHGSKHSKRQAAALAAAAVEAAAAGKPFPRGTAEDGSGLDGHQAGQGVGSVGADAGLKLKRKETRLRAARAVATADQEDGAGGGKGVERGGLI